MSPKTLFLALILLLTQIANSQDVEVKKPADDSEKLKKEAVAFLRESMEDVNNLRTLENRISFSAEMAGLMWFYDEKEARGMFAVAIGDFKELLMQYDSQLNTLGTDSEEIFSGGLIGDVSDRRRLMRKFQTAIQVRQQIASSIAEHDAELAFVFYYDTLSSISNVEFRKQMEERDSYFESQLMKQIADKDPGKAAKFGTKSLDKGLNYNHVELLRKIHAKDADKGVEFGAAILSRVKTEKLDMADYYVMSSLIGFGAETLEKSKKEGGKKPVYSQSDLHSIADVFAQAILNTADENDSSGVGYADLIEKYAPSRAAQIRAKFRNPNSRYYGNTANSVAYGVETAGNSMYASNSISNSNSSRYQREFEEREKLEQQMREAAEKIGARQLPKEEREKIITQARKILLQMPGRDKKILGLGALAAQVAKAGDKELAGEILKDAQNLVNPQPKNYQDFLFTLMLTAGYAEADPEKAFPMLEDTIYRVNDTISAFVKVGEFIDTAGEMIQDGEVQVGVFGGSMVRGMTSELGIADTTIRTLAKADFTKTKNLANRFDRAEVRILAKMMILRAVLGGKKEAKSDEEIN